MLGFLMYQKKALLLNQHSLCNGDFSSLKTKVLGKLIEFSEIVDFEKNSPEDQITCKITQRAKS